MHNLTLLKNFLYKEAERVTNTNLKEDIDQPQVCQDTQSQQEVEGSGFDGICRHGRFGHIIEGPLRITLVCLEVGDPCFIGVSDGDMGGRLRVDRFCDGKTNLNLILNKV